MSRITFVFAIFTIVFIYHIFAIPCSIFGRDEVYLDGKWTPLDLTSVGLSRSGDMFECCAGERYDSKVCADSNSPKVLDHGCSCMNGFFDEHPSEFNSSSNNSSYLLKFASYEWKPNHCEIASWNATLFCEKLGNRKILIIGDSTMAQTHATLQSMIYQSKEIQSKFALSCIKQIIFQLSDYLVYHPDESRGKNLLETFRANGFSYDIMTTGAHYASIIEEELHASNITKKDIAYAAYFFPKLTGDLQFLRNFYTKNLKRNITFIYKTSNTGHCDCEDFRSIGPIIEGMNDHLDRVKHDKYHWEHSYVLDQEIIEYAKKNISDLLILSMNPLFQRPDSHPGKYVSYDCLHYCTPGPLNIFSHFLLQAMINNEL
jgi:hypothetical protein